MPEPQPKREEALAARLQRASLPLAYALRCATDVAAALRELHEAGAAHGGVAADAIYLSAAGATLAALEEPRNSAAIDDVAAFGAVLFEMLTGEPPSAGEPPAAPAPAPRHSREGVRNAALRLATKCMRAAETGHPDMRQVVTEVRLLGVQANQYPAGDPAPRPAGPRGIAARRHGARPAPSASRQRSAPPLGPRLVDTTGNALACLSAAAWAQGPSTKPVTLSVHLLVACSNTATVKVKSAAGARCLDPKPFLTEQDVQFAEMQRNSKGNATIFLTFHNDAAMRELQITRRNIGNPVAIVLNGRVVSAPVIAAASRFLYIESDQAAAVVAAFNRQAGGR
jgi:hypothetical protein